MNITYPARRDPQAAGADARRRRAKRVLEAQYQDAVRLQIDNLYTAFSDVLGARETIRFAEAARQGLGRTARSDAADVRAGDRTLADVSRIEALYEAAEVELMDAREASARDASGTWGSCSTCPGPRPRRWRSGDRSATSIRRRRRSTS